jgi:hypothetical protein
MATEHTPTTIYYDTLRNIPVPIQALCEAGLSATQWVLLYLMHHKELRPELLAMIHCKNKPLLWTNEDLQDLLDRFYLIREPHPDAPTKTDLMNFRPSERFTDLLVTLKDAWLPAGHYQSARPVEEQKILMELRGRLGKPKTADRTVAPVNNALETLEAFDELFQAYPAHISVQGELVSGRSSDYDTMAAKYAEVLARKGTPPHEEILDLVLWAKANNRITMGLQKFIASREWLGLAELRDQGFAGGTFNNQDAI